MTAKRAHDRPPLWLVRQPQGLVPISAFDADQVERFRIGAHVVCTLEQPTDDKTRRRLFGLIDTVAKGTGDNPMLLRTRMVIQAGYIASVTHVEGVGTSITPKHISDLEQPELEDLFWRVVEIVQTDYLPHIHVEDLVRKINRYIGIGVVS